MCIEPGLRLKTRLRSRCVASFVVCLLAVENTFAEEEERANFFNDPFEQVTDAIATCPMQRGPMITRAEMRAESHWRVERGTSCYLSGRCRLPNAYLYDKEIVPRVKIALLADGRFGSTSIWVEGQHRSVWLKGCVETASQAAWAEEVVRNIDDVEAVLNQLVVVVPRQSGAAVETR